jgi:hypothetical protein
MKPYVSNEVLVTFVKKNLGLVYALLSYKSMSSAIEFPFLHLALGFKAISECHRLIKSQMF